MVPPVIAALGYVIGLIVLLVGLGSVYLVTVRFGDDGRSPEGWRREAAALTRELVTVLEAGPTDGGRVARTVLPLAGRFDRVAREAPREVDEELVRLVYRLSVDCREFGHAWRDRARWLEGHTNAHSSLLATAEQVIRRLESGSLVE